MSQSKPIRRVAVIGTGVIGASWTALFLAHGLEVVATDVAPGAEAALKHFVAAAWPALQRLGLASGASQSKLTFSAALASAVKDVDLVQENGPEKIDFKRTLYRELDELLHPSVIIASSSSGLTMSEIQSACELHPERCVIGHPFNPPHLIPLVEVVPGEHTCDESVQRAVEFYTALGRTPVVERKEIPGFVGNRLQNALSREAIYLVEQGVVTPEDLDKVITNSLGIRWATVGPFLGSHLGGGPGGYRHMAEHIGKSMKKMWAGLGTPSQTPEEQERLIEAVETAYGSSTYSELSEARDRKQLAVLAALEEN